MGQKINSNALRLGISKNWKSIWYSNGAAYTDQLHEDLLIKKEIRKRLGAAGLDRIEIKRTVDKLEVTAYVARPGVAIGRGGAGIEDLNKSLSKLVVGTVEVKVNEVSKPDVSASVLASEIESGLLRRMPPKLLAANVMQKARGAGAKGIKVWVSGRINGAQQARVIKFADGAVPLQTLKADIDYASQQAATKEYGIFGIKVWVYNPEESNNSSK